MASDLRATNTWGGTKVWLVGQIALIALAALVLAGWPSRGAPLMLVPLGESAAVHTVPLALSAHAILLAPGPLPRSYIVRGDRDALARTMLRSGILVLSGSARGCGTGEAQA